MIPALITDNKNQILMIKRNFKENITFSVYNAKLRARQLVEVTLTVRD